MGGDGAQEDEETAGEHKGHDPLDCRQQQREVLDEVILVEGRILADHDFQLMGVHQQRVLTRLRVAQDRAQRARNQRGGFGDGIGEIGKLNAGRGTFLVLRKPWSISVTMVLLVPLGPIPYRMNIESIIGVPCPAFLAVAVLSGLGVINCEVLKEEQMLRLAVCIDCMASTSQSSALSGKQIWICVTAAESKLVMFPTVLRRFTNPPQVPSPLRTVSRERKMLQLAMVEQVLVCGMQDMVSMQRMNTPQAKKMVKTIQTLVSRLLQGSLSKSRRMASQGGQLRSKRQQATMPRQTSRQTAPKMMQGTIISETYLPKSFLLPVMTMDCTRAMAEGDWKPAQRKEPRVAAAVLLVVLAVAMSNCAGQFLLVTEVQARAEYAQSSSRKILQLILFYYPH